MIAVQFLQHCNPAGLTMLTHSHSETLISLLTLLHEKEIRFRVLQTLSSPGEEGKKSLERMRERKIRAELIEDVHIKEAIDHSDLILMGCDALLGKEFLNKIGTRTILQQADRLKIRSFLIAESRKKIRRPEWKNKLKKQALFEWVPLDLVDRIVSER